jgi:myo-inositol-1(or 4)-monophosphatase
MAAGRCHVYLHGNAKLWDYAAGHLVFQETGGYSTTLDGESFFSCTLDTRSAVAALDKDMFQAWIQWLGVELADPS